MISPEHLGFGYGSSRFSDPEETLSPSERFGIVYFGSSVKVCFAEAILRERAIGSLGAFPIAYAELEAMQCASVEIDEPLLLADMCSDGLLRMRIPTDVARAASHDLGKLWSRALWLHDQQPDGIIYESRLNGETNIALFDRALFKLSVASEKPLLEFRDTLAEIINDFRIEIV